MAEVPAFRESGNPDILPELEQHVRDHVEEIIHLFGGGALGDFGFVSGHARRRAEQRFPLEVSLHAYRCGHRVLSHCGMGFNRSALIAGRILHQLGMDGPSIVERLRERRPGALFNEVFAEHIGSLRIERS